MPMPEACDNVAGDGCETEGAEEGRVIVRAGRWEECIVAIHFLLPI